MRLSETFRAAIKTSRIRQYEQARHIGIHPSTLSAWVNGIFSVRPDNPRVRELAQFLGVPADRVFADESEPAIETRSARR